MKQVAKLNPVAVTLSLKAYLLLKNEYPLTIPFIKYNVKADNYELKITVNDLAPVELFFKWLGVVF